MIPIQRFREWLIELKEAANRQSGEAARIEGIALAVREGHLVRKLRDRRGIILCAKYPDCQTSGDADNHADSNDIVLFLLEKVPSGQQTDEDELAHYAALQRLMLLLREQILESPLLCGGEQAASGLATEWEYDICGGWNGLSIGFKLQDNS